MPSKKVESWSQQWRSAGYRNEPGGPITRPADELLQEDKDEAELDRDETEVETIVTNSTRVGHHDGHPRTHKAEYSPSGVLRITFSHGVRTYHVSPDQWASFKSANEAGSCGPWIDANLR